MQQFLTKNICRQLLVGIFPLVQGTAQSLGRAVEISSIFLQTGQHFRWTYDEHGLGNTLTF